jgi:hypothetical protein
VISGAYGAISELQLLSRLPGLLRWASPSQFWLRSSLFKGLGAKTCHKITPNPLVPQGGRSRSESPRRGLRDEGWSYDSLSRFLLDLERSLANQRRGSRLSFLSEKQYLISADRSRNCRFISPSAPAGRTRPEPHWARKAAALRDALKNGELTAAPNPSCPAGHNSKPAFTAMLEQPGAANDPPTRPEAAPTRQVADRSRP